MSEFTKDDMTLLVHAIRNEKCVFFLGPGVTINFGREGLLDQFLGEQLRTSLPPSHQKCIVAYNPLDRFFIFDKPASRNKLYQPLKDFYGEERPNPLLDKLAEIPFHLAITVTPDLSLNQAFKRNGMAFSHEYFDKAVLRDLKDSPSKSKPLLYNLFGCILADETLITTHLELYETLKSMFAGTHIPKELVKEINSYQLQHVVFLGFEFDKWYYQLVLYLLNLNNADSERTAPDSGAPIDFHTKAFYETDFRINFISHDLMAFVEDLHGRFEVDSLRKGQSMGNTVGESDRNYNSLAVYNLLKNGFTAVEFEGFCLQYFHEVYVEFTPGMTQGQRINLLMEHCTRAGTIAALLKACSKESPYQFDQWGPYHE
jgi:hypothetical protein